MSTENERLDLAVGGREIELVSADGFDAAILGLEEKPDGVRVIYSVSKAIDILVQRDGMSRQEATEFLEFNVINGAPFPGGPIWCDDINLSLGGRND